METLKVQLQLITGSSLNLRTIHLSPMTIARLYFQRTVIVRCRLAKRNSQSKEKIRKPHSCQASKKNVLSDQSLLIKFITLFIFKAKN